MKGVNIIALILIVIGALNWGLWGFFQFDVVAWAAGGHYSWLSRTIYSIIGLAGVWGLSFFCRCCGKGCKCACKDCKCNSSCSSNSCKK